jgi:hypothetical protein
MTSKISADLVVNEKKSGKSAKKTIEVESSSLYQVANRHNWNDIFAKSIIKFIKQLKNTFPGHPYSHK